MGCKILATGVSYIIGDGWSSSTMGFCASRTQWVCDVVSIMRRSIKAYQVCVMSPVAINMGVKWILALWKMCDMLGIFSHSFYPGRKSLWLPWPECSSATFLLKEAMIPRVYIWNTTSFVPDCGNVTLQISVYKTCHQVGHVAVLDQTTKQLRERVKPWSSVFVAQMCSCTKVFALAMKGSLNQWVWTSGHTSL